MSKALGMIEFATVSTGVTAADAMVKAANVTIIEAQTVCPGKYIALIEGDLSAVDAAVTVAKTQFQGRYINSFILGNPHRSIFPAIYGTVQIDRMEALGIIESYDASSIIVAADVAAKTAIVELVELRIAKGMCGKSFLVVTGQISDVTASIEKAKETIAKNGTFLDSTVIAHPDEQICKTIL